MSETPIYTEHHPRWYRPRISTWWWLERPAYVSFILRELSSIFVAWAIVFLLLLIQAVAAGAESYQGFLDWSGHPVVLLLNLASLFFIVFHAVTWFNLAPQAMVVKRNGKRVPAHWIAWSNHALWAVVSAIVAWVLLG